MMNNMEKEVYLVMVDAGDGSGYIRYYESEECFELLEKEYPEEYWMNEGSPTILRYSGEISAKVSTIEDVRAEIAERKSYGY